MSSYNNGDVQTEYMDPQIYVENGRASFSLDASKLAYLPNMRLLNVGVSANAATEYNRLVGSMSVIRNIRLLDGRTELSALRNPATYLGFKSQQRTNADNKSTASWLKNSMVGLEPDENTNLLNHVYVGNSAVDINQPDAAANGTKVGYLDLMEVFPILGALPCLPTDVFPNLRVEVEFHSQASAQITKDGTKVTKSVRPILAVDCVENPELVRALSRSLKESGARWLEIENDRISAAAVPDAATGGTANKEQPISQQSMAYVGKRVERLLICKNLQDPANVATKPGKLVLGYGNLGSMALQAQTTQIRLNGKNVFPGFNGISRPNQRLGLLSDEYGACSGFPGSNLYKWAKTGEVILFGAAANEAAADVEVKGKNFAGQLSYDCVRIGAKVADLQIQITRTADGVTPSAGGVFVRPTNEALNINLYAEVDKALVMGRDGQYRIVYA